MNTRILLGAGALLLGGALLAGCTTVPATVDNGDTASGALIGEYSAETVLAANENATRVTADEWDPSTAVPIALDGATATSSAGGVRIDGSTVTITTAGVYSLSGALEGQLVVDAPEDALVALILDGVRIDNKDGAAIAVLKADDVVISLADGTTNRLSDAASYPEGADVNAALFSEEDLTITGDGTLIVDGNGNDGITSEDDLVILSGTIIVTAVDDGIRGKDSLSIEGGTITVTAGDDGLKADNDADETRGYIHISGGRIDVTSAEDAIDAETDVIITGGEITISAGDDAVHAEAVLVIEDGSIVITDSEEGLEGFVVAIAGGDIEVTSRDDGLNASGGDAPEMTDGGQLILISGGTLRVDAEGDGIDSNGSIRITGGDTVVNGPTRQGDGALDANGSFTISGGTLLATGSSGMAVSPQADSAQSFVADAFTAVQAGSAIQLRTTGGEVLTELTAPKTLASLVYSSPEVVGGQQYEIVVDGTVVATVEAGTELAGMGGPGGFGGQGGFPGGGQGGGMPPGDRAPGGQRP